MIVSGRNNVKEILKNFEKNYGLKKLICQRNFNENDILSLAKRQNVPIEYREKRDLDALAKNNHQGVLLDMRDFEYVDYNSFINKDKCFIIILDHIEDPHNLGAIVRTCEASGVDGIILPLNRSVSVNETVMKTSTGALYNVNIAQVTNLKHTIDVLKKNGFWIVGADMDGESYSDFNYPDKTCLIIGSEGFGMSRIVKDSCDYVVSIPMRGKVNSLNASVAAGVLIYEIIKR